MPKSSLSGGQLIAANKDWVHLELYFKDYKLIAKGFLALEESLKEKSQIDANSGIPEIRKTER